MNSKLDGPLIGHFESDTQGVIKQEFITYRVKNGMLTKEVTTRRFTKDGTDYIDTATYSPLWEVK